MAEDPKAIAVGEKTLKLKGMNFQEHLYEDDAYADNTLTVAKKTTVKQQIRTCMA